MKLQGIFLPTATPFDHNGELYRAKVRHNVNKWNRTSLAGYVVCGGVGESASLSSEEKVRLWEWVAECAAPDKMLIAAGGDDGLRETVRLMALAAELGYRAALIDPRSRGWSGGEQELYVRAVADQAKIPVIVQSAGGELPPHPNVVAAILNDPPAMSPSVPVLAGSETGFRSALAAGATGAVLALANAAPYSLVSIWEAHRARETEAAEDWQRRITRPAQLVTKYGIPGLKCAMDLNGYYGGACRLPLVPLSSPAKREIQEAFGGLGG